MFWSPYSKWFLSVVQMLDVFVCVLLSVAFYTLLERKLLGLIQSRLGPNKVGFLGILQPFSDAMKLISKTQSTPSSSMVWGYLLAPVLSFILPLMTWVIIPSTYGIFSMKFGLLFLLLYLSMTSYPLIFSGWFSNSKYASIGGIRSVALSLSYEIPLSFGIMGLAVLWKTPVISSWGQTSILIPPVLCQLGLLVVLFICFMVETGRSPFDLAEGESELVSGYCVEYGGGLYVLVFLGEYTALFLSGMIISMMLFNGSLLVVLGFVFLAAWIRSTLPRIRFDFLMLSSWVVLLPMSMAMFFLNSTLQ
uniref:NADH-ubiquinone oxidoreductase chain 1 n=1 Tax=Bovicola ovis TaxID=186214 RepID=A0A386B2D7_9NEOP|nr:NADH dehydrogenase subunit 1 [Bovicola ovis]